jgi:hypothetical protein
MWSMQPTHLGHLSFSPQCLLNQCGDSDEHDIIFLLPLLFAIQSHAPSDARLDGQSYCYGMMVRINTEVPPHPHNIT